RELRGERSRRELREREPLDVVLLADPPLALDEVALHVTRERDRPAEPDGPELQEVTDEAAQRHRPELVRSLRHQDIYITPRSTLRACQTDAIFSSSPAQR